jgi:hypothetical protein
VQVLFQNIGNFVLSGTVEEMCEKLMNKIHQLEKEASVGVLEVNQEHYNKSKEKFISTLIELKARNDE